MTADGTTKTVNGRILKYVAGILGQAGSWVDIGPAGGGSSGSSSSSSSSSSGSSGGSSSGSSGGGSAKSSGLSPYIQEYRNRFFAKGSPPSSLLSQATSKKWSLAYFDTQVRLTDPNYWKSTEASLVLPHFNQTMKVLFPGLSSKQNEQKLMATKFYKNVALWYLRNGVGLKGTAGTDLLYNHITSTTRWKANNPYWNAYERNQNIAVQSEANPMLYKAYLDGMKSSFGAVGLNNLPEDYYKTFFRSRYASANGMKEMTNNLQQYGQQGGSFGWWQGQGMNPEQTKAETLNAGVQGQDLRSRLNKAFSVQKSVLGSTDQGFQTGMSNNNQIVNPNL